MKQVNTYLHKKVLVLGLAKSGVSAASLLHKLGAFVTVNDQKPLAENPEGQKLLEQGITVICGEHPADLLDEGFEIVVKNPGIPYDNLIVQKAIDKGIPIITEIELAYEVSEAPFIGITGTNGKTTTTTLIFEMLKEGNQSPLIGGNIGTVASSVAEKAKDHNKIVTELSSFQLLGINKFKPKIAVLTNLYEAHLDYHGTIDEYHKAKAKITENQTEDDYFIVNWDQEKTKEIAYHTRAKVIPFSRKHELDRGIYIKEDAIWFGDEKVIDLKDILLPGEHNLENILASVGVAKICGVTNEAICRVLQTFKGVEHRLQFVAEINGRKFYNDSKATNLLATQNALKSFAEPIILLAGGLDRGNGFDELIPYMNNVKALVTFGQTAEKIEVTGKKAGIKRIVRVENVEKAVPVAYDFSNEGDVILLSPACASWDQYKTFEERGDIFCKAVHKL